MTISIMIVDDSAVIRGILTQILEAESDMKVIASASNGAIALDMMKGNQPDVILLDIEMPVMDGLTALPRMVAMQPNCKVLMCSTLSVANGEATMKAFSLGAADCVAKPTSFSNIANGVDFKDELRHKIRAIVSGSARPHVPPTPNLQSAATASGPALARVTTGSAATSAPAPDLSETIRTTAAIAAKMAADAPIELRATTPFFKPALLAIGASTGGPKALPSLITHLKNISVPVVLTQHMPATFTKILADQLQTGTGVPVHEAAENDVLQPGHVYVAPGGQHMAFAREGGRVCVRLNAHPPVNFCRPAVDVMLNSAIDIFGSNILCVMLTGMGADGYAASQRLVSQGGQVIAQDRATSVVWGMPGAVALGGLCSAVLPLEDIGPQIRRNYAHMFLGSKGASA